MQVEQYLIVGKEKKILFVNYVLIILYDVLDWFLHNLYVSLMWIVISFKLIWNTIFKIFDSLMNGIFCFKWDFLTCIILSPNCHISKTETSLNQTVIEGIYWLMIETYLRKKGAILNFNKLRKIDGNFVKINSNFSVNELKIVLNESNWQRHIFPISKYITGRNTYSAQFWMWPEANVMIMV